MLRPVRFSLAMLFITVLVVPAFAAGEAQVQWEGDAHEDHKAERSSQGWRFSPSSIGGGDFDHHDQSPLWAGVALC